jgi:hypothetical protein
MADQQAGVQAGVQWTATTAALAAALREGWRAAATALWMAGRRREAAWVRAEYHDAAAVVAAAGAGRPRDAAALRRHCRAMAVRSARHALLAAPWREAARVLAVAAPAGANASARAGGEPW